MSFLFPSSTITFEAALRDLAQGSPKARAFAAHALGEITEPAEKRRALDALLAALDDDRRRGPRGGVRLARRARRARARCRA